MNQSVRLVRDSDPQSPRDWDNMGTMVCFHGRYNLGDKHDYKSDDYNGWDEMEAAIERDNPGGIILPLYLYDHSGITMNTTGFHCPWDSGRVGFIVASAAKIRECFAVKRITKAIRKRATASLVSEVEVYDDFLTGNVYGFEVLDEEGEVTDSCWGFFGSDPFKNGIAEHVPEELHEALRNAETV